MGFTKFSPLAHGEYWENYFRTNSKFYDLIKDHMEEGIRALTSPGMTPVGIDLGAGPGVGARLAFEANLKATIIGYEPSDTHEDGVLLAEELSQKSGVSYYPRKEGIEKMVMDDFDFPVSFMTALRSSHEMADSVGGKGSYFRMLGRAVSPLLEGGIFIVGEPQFTHPITNNPEHYVNLIQEVQKYQMEVIKHCHVPSDYFTNDEMKSRMAKLNFELVREDVNDNEKVLEGLQEKGVDVQESPCQFYVQTYRRKI